MMDRPNDGCRKGCCMRAATRVATYTYGLTGETDTQLSCDEHGGDPAQDVPEAEAARRWNKINAHWLR